MLLVDDSRVNVNVMRKMLTRLSSTWLRRSVVDAATVEIFDADVESDIDGGLRQNSRSHVYKFQDEPSISRNRAIHDETVSEVVRFDFSEADDGVAAVRQVQAASEAESPFDIVFMDNIMLVMHGPEAAQAMRAGGFQGLIIGVTGNVMAEDMNQYMASGADYVLGKPVNMDELKQILYRLTL